MNTLTWQRVLLAVCIAVSSAMSAQPLWADTIAEVKPPVERDLGNDRFLAGCPIAVDRPVAGDLIAAGCDVDVTAEVAGDVIVMGGNLRLAAPVKQGVFAAGGRISIEGPVQRNVRVAGGRIHLNSDAKIGGNVTIGGGEIDIDGAIGGYLQVGGGKVLINGPVAGNVEIGAGHVELGPNARIEGKLSYSSGDEIDRDPAAQVKGGVEQVERGERWGASHHWHYGERHHHGWFWSLGLLIIAAILVAALPEFYKGVAATTRTHWALAILIGFIVLVCVPISALLFAITLIGIPVALVLMVLYLMLLLVGCLSTGIAIGEIALQSWRPADAAKQGWRIGAAVLALLALMLLGCIPFVGGLVRFAALLMGMGVVLMQLRTSRAAPAAPGA